MINFDYDPSATTLIGFDDGNGRTIAASPGIPGTMATTADTLGNTTLFSYTAPIPTSATHRPVPYALLSTIITPDQPTLPHTEYDYDSEGRVQQVKDAEALQVGDRLPWQFFIADGTRGGRQDPLGGLYSVVYDSYGHGSRFIDELNRETDALFDSRDRPLQYLYPENDCDLYLYDVQNNVTSLTKEDKASGCNAAAIGSHRILTRATWDQTWNKILTLTTPRNNVTRFTYYSLGHGASLMHPATRPSPDGFQAAPGYSFASDAAGKLTTATDPIGIVKQNAYDTAEEHLRSTTLDPGTGTHVGAVTSYSYDAIGNTIHTTDPRGAVTEDSFDSERRKTESHHHDGAITATLNEASRTTYDALDRDIKDETGLTFSGTTVATWPTDKTTV